MNLISAFLCYAIATLICIGLPIVALIYAQKKDFGIKFAHFIIGIFFFAVFFILYYLVLRYHLTASDEIADYYNTPFYRVVIITLITILSSVLLWIFGMIVYMRRQLYKACLSFFAGFGIGGCAMIGLYAFLMFVMLAIQCLSASFVSFDKNVQAFYFSDGTYFSVFQPMSGHVSFAVAAVSFLLISLMFALIMNRITSAQVPFLTTALSFVGLILSLATLLVVFCFMGMFGWSHYVMALVSVACALLAAGMTVITYKFVKSPEKGYRKQFD